MIHKITVINKNIFNKVTSLSGLFLAWKEFKKGKEGKLDVQEFFLDLEKNILNLFRKIKNGKYEHSKYAHFFVCDPKLRSIHKAEVMDRVLHHSIVKHIGPLFERSFIFDSYSSRIGKGTHRAIKRLKRFCLTLTKNKTKTAWALKCDIKKFFDSVDHEILLVLIKEKVKDKELLNIIERVIRSYDDGWGRGIPLGNLTSQLFSNIYLNRLDNFVKRELGVKYYLRYADDFIILNEKKDQLEKMIPILNSFLTTNLKLNLHPKKLTIKKIHQGIDFLGYVIFPTHIILRTKTKRRMFKKIIMGKAKLKSRDIDKKSFNQSLQSYLGLLSHCRGWEVKKAIKKIIGKNI